MGRKPIAYCGFLFDVMGLEPDDELEDLFPGTGIVGRAWANMRGSSREGAFRRPRQLVSSPRARGVSSLGPAPASGDVSSSPAAVLSSPSAAMRTSATEPDDVRRVVPPWGQLLDLIEGARQRGYTQDQIDYLRSVVGVGWAKAWHAGRASVPETSPAETPVDERRNAVQWGVVQ